MLGQRRWRQTTVTAYLHVSYCCLSLFVFAGITHCIQIFLLISYGAWICIDFTFAFQSFSNAINLVVLKAAPWDDINFRF